jgi:hypothetical protein
VKRGRRRRPDAAGRGADATGRGRRATRRAARPGRQGAASARPRAALPSARGRPRIAVQVQELEALRAELARRAKDVPPARWNADPEEVQRSVARLVLTLVEFVRQLLERQAIRRMEAQTLTAEETEAVGLALMRLEKTIRDIGRRFGLEPRDLNLDLGPLGRLL